MQKVTNMAKVERLKKKLATIKKRIEKHKRLTIQPFTPLIMKSQKNGTLDQLLEVCNLIAKQKAVSQKQDLNSCHSEKTKIIISIIKLLTNC